MTYASNTTLELIAARLRGVKKVLLTAHAKPDGDAMGAVAALGAALEAMGKRVERRIMGPIAGNLAVLTSRAKVIEHQANAEIDEPDAIVVLDTGAWSQLETMRSWLEGPGRHAKTIVIDHHQRGDDVGAMLYVDSQAAAACELVAALIDELGVKRDALMTDALFIGLATDTGWFRFSNTTAGTHELAAALVRDGANTAALYAATEQADRPQKLALLQRALNSLRFVAGGRAAVMVLRQSDFDETGARIDETERFVDVPQFVERVRVVALVVGEKGRTRLSLRSKPPAPAPGNVGNVGTPGTPGIQGGARPRNGGLALSRLGEEGGEGAVDVNELAGQFGGGGHQRAAGAKTDQPVDEVIRRLIAAIEERTAGA
ncbi:MAG: DHH family phosphoesterase [Phycisphaerales bacterium]